MSRTIMLKTPHNLGKELAKQRITERFDSTVTAWLGAIGTATMTWSGDTALVKAKVVAQTVIATIEVEERDIAITIGLPILIAPFAGAIETFLKSNADVLRPD